MGILYSVTFQRGNKRLWARELCFPSSDSDIPKILGEIFFKAFIYSVEFERGDAEHRK
jgi:hypothetical protein